MFFFYLLSWSQMKEEENEKGQMCFFHHHSTIVCQEFVRRRQKNRQVNFPCEWTRWLCALIKCEPSLFLCSINTWKQKRELLDFVLRKDKNHHAFFLPSLNFVQIRSTNVAVMIYAILWARNQIHCFLFITRVCRPFFNWNCYLNVIEYTSPILDFSCAVGWV